MTTLEELIASKNNLLVKFMTIKNELDDIENKITDIITPVLAQARTIQGKETGVINALVQGFNVKEDVPKTVKWDNSKLAAIYKNIAANDEDPEKYIKKTVKESYTVPEKEFKSFEPEIKEFFNEARTIVHGQPKITIEKKEK